jgi:hypothetical protein
MAPEMHFNSEEGSSPSTNQRHFPMCWIRPIFIMATPTNPAEGNLPIVIHGGFVNGWDGDRERE